MAREQGSGIGSRVVYGMVAYILFFAVLEVLEGLGGWNATSTYATIVKATVPVFIGLYIIVGNRLESALTRG